MKWRIRCIFFTWQGFWFTRCSSILVLARAQLCPTLCDPMDYIARHTPLAMEFPRQGYCSELPCPPPEDRPNPGIEPRSPALQADSLPSEPPGKPSIGILMPDSRLGLTAQTTLEVHSSGWNGEAACHLHFVAEG